MHSLVCNTQWICKMHGVTIKIMWTRLYEKRPQFPAHTDNTTAAYVKSCACTVWINNADREAQLPSFLTSTFKGTKWSASGPGRFIPSLGRPRSQFGRFLEKWKVPFLWRKSKNDSSVVHPTHNIHKLNSHCSGWHSIIFQPHAFVCLSLSQASQVT